ncbi:MAG TPA: hypothetical protein DDW52_04045 [Planctomycetaceae bacterium]|nr:hypothetical protein [Planctomycetaceae bacterium]
MAKYLQIPSAFEAVTGRRPHPSTCWRWATKGCKGTRLQTFMVGGRRLTTVEAVREFIDECSRQGACKTSVSKTRALLNRELGIN